MLIEAGYLGIKGDIKLPKPNQNYPVSNSKEGLQLLTINFEERKEILMKSEWLRDLFDKDFLTNYLTTVQQEFDHFKGMSIE